MDAKITKSRLGLLLSYDWIKIIGICVAAVLLWTLLFTTLATRATSGQIFEIYAYAGVRANFNQLGTLDGLHRKGALSRDVLEFTSTSLTSDYGDTILQAHTSAGQGDVIFVPDTADETDEEGNVTGYTGLKNYLSSYFSNSYWLGEEDLVLSESYTMKSYFTSCAEYLGRFFKTDGQADLNGTLDKSAAETNFRSRIKGDKRYKNETQIAAGLEEEYVRLENLRTSFNTVYEWTHNDSADDPIELRTVTMTYTDASDKEQTAEWTFAFDLGNVRNLSEFVADTSVSPATSENMCMAVMRSGNSSEEDLRYEPFTFLTYLAEKFG